MPDLHLNRKYGIEHFKRMSNIAICHNAVVLNINFNSVKTCKLLKIAEIKNSKESGPRAELKFVFSENPSQKVMRLVYQVEESRLFMEVYELKFKFNFLAPMPNFQFSKED